jgi:hypothetical protein
VVVVVTLDNNGDDMDANGGGDDVGDRSCITGVVLPTAADTCGDDTRLLSSIRHIFEIKSSMAYIPS